MDSSADGGDSALSGVEAEAIKLILKLVARQPIANSKAETVAMGNVSRSVALTSKKAD